MILKDILEIVHNFAFLSKSCKQRFYDRILLLKKNDQSYFKVYQPIFENIDLFINQSVVSVEDELIASHHDRDIIGEIYTVYMPNLEKPIICKFVKQIFF